MPQFTVDTHLFRELGALLVGRDSTALVELIKNAYDADATLAVVYGEHIGDLNSGLIQIRDDGVGMTRTQFEQGFLRIAGRTKDTATRTSPLYRRRFTGAKGIGRLAAHKLSRTLAVLSAARDEGRLTAIEASIDWDEVERATTIDEVGQDAVVVSTLEDRDLRAGTTITLRRLRKAWTIAERARFLAEVQTFEPPDLLTSPWGSEVLAGAGLFTLPTVRDSSEVDPGFHVQLEGDLAPDEDYWQVVAEQCSWIVEIDARTAPRVAYLVAPTARTVRDVPETEAQRFEQDVPDLPPMLRFQARILIREGRFQVPGPILSWASRVSGVRVYLEGFRVLPYGERGNDWLALDQDYARRSRTFPYQEELPEDAPLDPDAALMILPNASYFGAVFLTEEGAKPLQMLVNREGFLPDASYIALVETVRRGISLSVRVRAQHRATAGQRPRRAKPHSPLMAIQGTLAQMSQSLSLLDEATPASSEASRVVLGDVKSLLTKLTSQVEDVVSETNMTRILASVGTQMSAFVHEVGAILQGAGATDAAMEQLRLRGGFDPQLTSDLADLARTIRSLREGLERQASFLTDVVSVGARRRRVRTQLQERVGAVFSILQPSANRLHVQLRNDVAADAETIPMFRAEVTAVLMNLGTNAIKAAGENGKVRASAFRDDDARVHLRIENTGVAVDLSSAERWFKPFESTTFDADPVLGQGMGMGLPIARRILSEYGIDAHFVGPSDGFATAIDLTFPR
jgi:signal transduction histidine kinase